jgi:hypothetical protein
VCLVAGKYVSLNGGPMAFQYVRIDRHPTRETYIITFNTQMTRSKKKNVVNANYIHTR